MLNTQAWTLGDWQQAYRDGASPRELLSSLLASLDLKDPAWISLVSASGLERRLAALEEQRATVGLAGLPLYGIPFAVKDNIDTAGLPTTCACPAFSHEAGKNASVVEKLVAAGAVMLGKTNLDQFATGLVGTRSPYGAVPNTFKPEYISGGSSSGSAVVVARGQVPFSLGTDTAGSGRVPAGLNNIVGLKPTVGLFSTLGVVPACRTLDCVSVFALTVEDADYLRQLMSGFDAADPFSRPAEITTATLPAKPVFGIPAEPQFFGDEAARKAWEWSLEHLSAMGATLKTVDFNALHDVAALLYEGPWVAERFAAIEDILESNPEALNPVVRRIIDRARGMSAVDAFRGEYRRAELALAARKIMAGVDALVVPTAPGIYTQAQIEAEPVKLNTQLGTYTNFVNLMDWCALALPACMRSDGLPFGITLIAPAWKDAALADFGKRWQKAQALPLGATAKAFASHKLQPLAPTLENTITVAVVGAHLSGMPLNTQLVERGAVLLESTKTAEKYKFFALPGTVPPKPGLLRVGSGGSAIAIELWAMPVQHFGSFVGLIPSPLGIGTLETADGREVKGFICEPWALEGAQEITEFGGWRAFMASRA
ncbi:MAG: allophanate hydrolase [Pedobacter sp.]|nr:allophanate hydrolase [Pedobacter sp.]